jgi:hypothetical protein
MKIENESLEKSNNPIIPPKFNEKEHKIFVKYITSNNKYKYIYELLNTLCANSKSRNKTSLFHKSLHCFLKILYNLNNNENVIELDLLILCSFYLGLKLNEIRTKIPKIPKLKEIYPKKYHDYDHLKIRHAELLCIKLLDYNIDILTSYDCLLALLYGNNNNCYNNNIFSLALKELENVIKNNIGDYITVAPMEMAERCIVKAKNINQHGHSKFQSLLIKEYNKNNEQLNKVKNDDNNNNKNYVKQMSCTINRLKHPNLFSCQKLNSNSRNNDNYNDNNNIYNSESSSKYSKKHTNSIYNCSFKILRKLSNVNNTKSNFSSKITSFSDIKNSINLNVNTCTIGKKIFENNIGDIVNTTKKSSQLFKSVILLSNSNRNKEEKENYSNSNLLLNKNKDINCLRYHNKVIMIGQKKLFE